MPKGRSTFSKRQKEQARQQGQRDKTLGRNERKQSKPDSPSDDLAELHERATAQAALFHVGHDQPPSNDEPAIDPGEDKNP
jgi:hypothetical protein